MSELLIDENTRIQILDTMLHAARARKHQYAAFVRDEGVLLVWADRVENIIPAAEALEEALIHFIWKGEEENKKYNQAILVDEALEQEEKALMAPADEALDEKNLDPEDVVRRKAKRQWKERPVMLFAPLMDGLSIILCMCLIALGLSESLRPI